MLATTDREQALEWYEDLVTAGVEGLVTKPLTAPYRRGRSSGWLKIRHTTAADAEVLTTGLGARPRTARVRLHETGTVLQADIPDALRGQFTAALTQNAGPLQVEVRTGTGRRATYRITRVRPDA